MTRAIDGCPSATVHQENESPNAAKNGFNGSHNVMSIPDEVKPHVFSFLLEKNAPIVVQLGHTSYHRVAKDGDWAEGPLPDLFEPTDEENVPEVARIMRLPSLTFGDHDYKRLGTKWVRRRTPIFISVPNRETHC